MEEEFLCMSTNKNNILNFFLILNKMKTDKKIKELIDKVDSGDIILFSNVKFLQSLIQIATNSKFDHVGLVLKDKKKAYILEANTPLGFKKSIIKKDGVQINDLVERIKQYKGRIWFLKLNKRVKDITIDGKSGEEILWEFYEENKNKKFDILFPITVFSEVDNKNVYFCSELVADVFRRLGIFYKFGKRKNKKPHNVYPGEFWDWYKDSSKVIEVKSKSGISKYYFVKEYIIHDSIYLYK